MKKTLSLILAVMMLLGCMSITAFAETPKNQTDITAIVPAKALSYEMVIPAATTLTEEAHENVLLGADGKVSITNVKNGTDKVNVYYTVDLSNGTLTDGTNTIAATYKYKQGEGEFAAIDGTTKVTVYENATVKDSLVNVTADDTQWKAAPTGTYNATVVFNFAEEDAEPAATVTIADILPDEFPQTSSMSNPIFWMGGDMARLFAVDGNLNASGVDDLSVPLTTPLTPAEGNYTCTYDGVTWTFTMDGEKFCKVTISGAASSMIGDYTKIINT